MIDCKTQIGKLRYRSVARIKCAVLFDFVMDWNFYNLLEKHSNILKNKFLNDL